MFPFYMCCRLESLKMQNQLQKLSLAEKAGVFVPLRVEKHLPASLRCADSLALQDCTPVCRRLREGSAVRATKHSVL